MYPAEIVLPMKAELVDNGFEDLTTAAEVEQAVKQDGTTLVVINSVCGCSASTARPGVKAAVSASAKKPTNLATVFAGVDQESTQKAREYTLPYPPSSPSIALFKDGELVHFVERHHIEGRSAALIAQHLEGVFEEYC
jgi:putative YphP/YqiW family bacilliredoxin